MQTSGGYANVLDDTDLAAEYLQEVTSSSVVTDDRRYQVFLSSTFSDLVEVRQAVVQQILKMDRYIPAGMELFSASPQPPWDVITSALAGTDYMVLILGTRYGSIVPGEGISYTEKEYNHAIDNRIPVLAFLGAENRMVPANTAESATHRKLLKKFRDRVTEHSTIEHWSTEADLPAKVITALAKAVQTTPRPGWIRGDLSLPLPFELPSSSSPAAGGVKIEKGRSSKNRGLLRNEIDSLDQLATGLSDGRVEALLGPHIAPGIVGQLHTYIYRTKHVWVKTVSTAIGQVLAFSISVADGEFEYSTSAITKGQLSFTLGVSRFDEIQADGGEPDRLIFMGANYGMFRELFYFGSLGGYQHFVASCNWGVPRQGEAWSLVTSEHWQTGRFLGPGDTEIVGDPIILNLARHKALINTIAIIGNTSVDPAMLPANKQLLDIVEINRTEIGSIPEPL